MLLPPPPPPHTHTHTHQSEEDRDRGRGEIEAAGSTDSRAILNLAKALEEGALDQDPFVQQYRARRMDEMKAQAKLGTSQRYGIRKWKDEKLTGQTSKIEMVWDKKMGRLKFYGVDK